MKPFIIALIALLIFIPIAGLLLMILWAWVVPDVFSGMVAQELLPGTISFQQALKLLSLITLLSSGAGLGIYVGKNK